MRISALLKYNFIKDEIIQILSYNLKRLDFVSRDNDYSFTCPLDIHCQYTTRQILAAFDYYKEFQAPSFCESIKYFEGNKTNLFLINLNKSEKDFSPPTMYEDYATNNTLFH